MRFARILEIANGLPRNPPFWGGFRCVIVESVGSSSEDVGVGDHAPSVNIQVVVAGATDDFHVVITMCDVATPRCRTRSVSQSISDTHNIPDLLQKGCSQ